MEISLFLAKLFGPYLLVIGLSALLKRKMLSVRLSAIFDHPMLVYIMGSLELILGIVVLLFHNVWVWGWPLIITIWAWLAVIEGIMYLFTPASFSKKLAVYFMKKEWYVTFSVIAIIFGVYLSTIGYSLF